MVFTKREVFRGMAVTKDEVANVVASETAESNLSKALVSKETGMGG